MSNLASMALCGEGTPVNHVVSSADVGEWGSSPWSVTKQTLTSGRSAGVEVIKVKTSFQELVIISTRGMGLAHVQVGDTRVGWDSPVREITHPCWVDIRSRNGLGWVDGFNELIARCGLTSCGPPGNDEEAGALESELTLHGKIANLPAESVTLGFESTDDADLLVIRGNVREAALFSQNLELVAEYRIPLNEAAFTLRDQIVNHASGPAEAQLLYHINVGTPLLEKGASWLAPVSRITPRDERALEGIQEYADYLEPTKGYSEQVYFCRPLSDETGQSRVLLSNANASSGLSVCFQPTQLPCLTIWKNTQAKEDGYCTGIEPSTCYPNFKAQEREAGRVLSLAPGSHWEGELRFEFHQSAAEVTASQEKIQAIQEAHGAPQVDQEVFT